jgi:hypothetical protein
MRTNGSRPRGVAPWMFGMCVLAAVLVAASCGTNNSALTAVSVTLSSNTAQTVGQSKTFAITAALTNDTNNQGVTWSVTGAGTLTGSTTTATTYNSPATINSASVVTITAASVKDPSKTASLIINLAPISITLAPNTAQTVGQSKTLPITATLAYDTNSQGVTWAVTAGTLTGSTTTATTYNSPATINSASMVTVTATAVGNISITASLTINLAPISITLAPTSPTSVDQGKTVPITATLQNDTNSQGVTWTLTGAGSLSSSTTNPTTYTPPASVTSVTVKATAVGNATITATLTINVVATPSITTTTIPNGSIGILYPSPTVVGAGGVMPYTWTNPSGNLKSIGLNLDRNTGVISGVPTTTNAGSPIPVDIRLTDADSVTSTKTFNITVGLASPNACGTTPGGNEGLLKGEYAFYVQGFDGAAAPIALAASFNADGAGKVTAGDEDSTTSASTTHVTINPTGSSYIVGPDNRGCVTLVDSGSTTRTFRFALGGLSGTPAVASKGSIIEFDDVTGTNRRASGVLRLQTTTDFVLGNLKTQYAFGMDGLDPALGHYAVGGSFTLDNTTDATSGGITALFSDIDDAGASFPALSGGSGSLTVGSLSATTGRVSGSMAPDATHSYNLAVYIVNANELFVVATDKLLTAPHLVISGRMIVTSSPFTNASAAGTDLIHVNGTSGSPASPSGTIGILTFTTAGTKVTGPLYSCNACNSLATPPNPPKLQAVSGTYAVTSTSGRVALAGVTVGSTTLSALYLATPTDGISAFIVGSDTSANFGYAEAQSPTTGYTNASIASLASEPSIFGIDQMIDNTLTNDTGVETIDSTGSIKSGTVNFSGQGGLTINFAFTPDTSPSFNITSNGQGTWSGFTPITTPPTTINTHVVTNGKKLFLLDDTSGLAEIIVIEQ